MLETRLPMEHLLKLLDDESPQIQKILRESLLNTSLDIILQGYDHLFQLDPRQSALLQGTLGALHFELVHHAFSEIFSSNLEDIDLEKSLMVLAYWNNPALQIPTLTGQIDRMADEIRVGLPEVGHPLAFIDHINYFLFQKFGFQGNSADYYHPDNSFIDKVIDNKKGIPISLSVLYMIIARRLDIPILGIPMPAHFIIKFEDDSDQIFIDPFYGGKIYSREECERYLDQAKVEESRSILEGCHHFQILQRIMNNIHLVYTSYQDEPEKASEITRLQELLEAYFP